MAAAPPRDAAAPAPRAVIGPHAGHRYCGHVMAHAYSQMDPAAV
jgi:AmmeMemoRadiSam system protein B